jgi:peptidoglycan hydrolase CwlO-like protein
MADESIIIPIKIQSSDSNNELAKLGNSALSADNSLQKLVQQLQQGGSSLTNYGNNVKKAKTALDQLPGSINNVEQRVESFNKRLRETGPPSTSFTNNVNAANRALDKVNPSAGRATQSLTDLGRIVQDAPYGFIGISNNLNPALESFQRLKVETGSTGGALKALANELKGPAGIGLALAGLSMVLTLAQVGFSNWTRGLGKTKEEADEAKKRIEDLKNSIKGIYSDVAKEATNVGSLIGLLKNETETRERKILAIKELQRIAPDTFKNLKLEGDAVAGLDKTYKNYLENLKTVIAVRIKQAQLEQAMTRQLQLEGTTLVGWDKKVKDFQDAFVKGAQNAKSATGGGEIITPFTEKIKKDARDLADVQKDVTRLLDEISQLSKGIVLTPEKDKKEEDIVAKAKEIASWFEQNTDFQVNYNFSPLDTKAEAIQKAQTFLQEVARGLTAFRKDSFKVPAPEFKAPPPDILENYGIDTLDRLQNILDERPLEPVLGSSVNDWKIKIRDSFRQAFKQLNVPMPDVDFDKQSGPELERDLNAALKNAKATVPVYLNPQIPQGTPLKEAMEIAAEILKTELTSIVQNFANDLLVAAGEGIGAIISGSGGLSDLFKGLFGVIAGGLSAMGRAMIQYGTNLLLIKLAMKSLNPYLAIGAGVALVAAGSALKGSMTKATPFAEGGLVSGNVFAQIGEGRRTSRNNPEVVAPLDKLKSFFGSMVMDSITGRSGGVMVNQAGVNINMPSTVQLFARGRDLVGVLSLENQSQKRNF